MTAWREEDRVPELPPISGQLTVVLILGGLLCLNLAVYAAKVILS